MQVAVSVTGSPGSGVVLLAANAHAGGPIVATGTVTMAGAALPPAFEATTVKVVDRVSVTVWRFVVPRPASEGAADHAKPDVDGGSPAAQEAVSVTLPPPRASAVGDALTRRGRARADEVSGDTGLSPDAVQATLAALLDHRVATAHADGSVSPLSVLLDD